jgi:c-di-GMP-related signal transduction protein
MDVLLELPISDIVSQINPAASVRDALLAREGAIGRLLALAEHLEVGDQVGVKALLKGMPAEICNSLVGFQLEAFQWANVVSATLQDSGTAGAPS